MYKPFLLKAFAVLVSSCNCLVGISCFLVTLGVGFLALFVGREARIVVVNILAVDAAFEALVEKFTALRQRLLTMGIRSSSKDVSPFFLFLTVFFSQREGWEKSVSLAERLEGPVQLAA